MRRFFVVFCALSLLILTSTLFAQNYTANPLFGALTLNSGFEPDPVSVPVEAGGTDDASALEMVDLTTGMSCVGFIAAAQPDVRLHYTASATFPLRFYVVSAVDTTLAVNMPDATWRCNDDGSVQGYAGLNPVIHLTNPPSGQYDIWIGTYSPGAPQPATLYVTEMESSHPGVH